MTLTQVLDFFIHPKIKSDNSELQKTRVTVIAYAIVLFFNVSYTLFFIYNKQYWGVKPFHNYLAFALSFTGLSFIKWKGNTKLALLLGAIVGFYLVFASVFISGGIVSNDFLWFAAISVAGFMYIGIKEGFFITLASIIAITFFYFSDFFGWIHFEANIVALTKEYRYFNYVFLLIVLTLMVYFLADSNVKLQKIIQLSREQKVREDIARDFHDQIGNKLASLRHLSELLKMKKTDAEKTIITSKIDANAKDVYDNFRDFIWALDIKSDQLTELFMYLRDFADDCFKFSDVSLYTESSPQMLPNIVLPSYISKELVPLFKEAITNVQKHSNAKNVHLTFTILKNALTIQLEDDGKGIDKSIIKKGNGLNNMNYRAQKTGGKLEISSGLNFGTKVIYTLELLTINITEH